MKILFVFTGGTIGSCRRGELIGPDARMPYVLLERYREVYGIDFDFDVQAPYTALSEHNTGETLRLLCAHVRAQMGKGYDGIVVTHGTDTLQYTAAALSYALADAPVPICVVSAAAPIEQKDSNGAANLHGALRFIAEVGRGGVFVPYQNKGQELRIHNGTRLLESVAFSDRVESACDSFVGSFCKGEGFLPNPAYKEQANAMPALGAVALAPSAAQILRVQPHVGMCYPEIAQDVRYILHGSFHSGTLNTASAQALRFFGQARERGIPVFLCGVTRGAQYESTAAFDALGIQPLYGIAPIAAYVKLWMLHTLCPERPVTRELLQASLAGDVAV